MAAPQPIYHHLTSQIDQGVLVLTITERQVQGHTLADALRREMSDALSRSGARLVVVNFQNTQFISSVAFRPLLLLRRQLEGEKGRIVLCGLNKEVGDVFYTTHMIDPPTGSVTPLFEMEGDVPQAVGRLTRLPGS